MSGWSKRETEYFDLCEVPPAGSGKVKDYSDSNWSTAIRYWLIKKLAGKHTVIVNARINIIDRIDDLNVVGRATQTGKGMLMQSSYLHCDGEQMLLVSNHSK